MSSIAVISAAGVFTNPVQADVLFTQCSPSQQEELRAGLSDYFLDTKTFRHLALEPHNGTLRVSLKSRDTSNTLTIADDLELNIANEKIELPLSNGHTKTVLTVSKAEIIYALATKGRTTEFKGKSCSVGAFKDHVGLRQNIVAWAESLEWEWPEGGPAKWNKTFWNKGTPVNLDQTRQALWDVFSAQKSYSIGCYTASKLVYAHATLDYYHRVSKNPAHEKIVTDRLLSNNDPLTYIEPGAMWFFEEGQTEHDNARMGKLLKLELNVPQYNFIPGDWSYLLNTDPITYQKTGYEGSNAIYLGRGKFDDYYNDNNHSYTFKEKLHEVYQWRHHVFSRSRDVAKVQPLAPKDLVALSLPPSQGGLLFEHRAVPFLYGYEDLPAPPVD